MSKTKSKNETKIKIRYKNKKNSKKITKNDNGVKPVTSLLKREVSSNWLNFMKSNGNNGKVFIVNKPIMKETKVSVNKPKSPAVTKVVALDCEMVSDLDDVAMLARVTLVNYKLECIYDKFVKPTSKVGDYRTRFSGIREEDINNGADFEEVRQEVRSLLYNKILVGHALHNDFKVLKFGHHRKLIRDTASYPPFKENDAKSPSLKKLAKVFLNETIQEGEHNSIEDAQTAMKLYKKFRHEWEISLINSKSKIEKSELVPE